MEDISVIVMDTTYRNDDNGYTVLRASLDNKNITAVGCIPGLIKGERIKLRGEWIEHYIYGEQFKIQSIEIEKLNSLNEIENYLGSGIISGMREATAKTLVETFGEDTLNVLDNTPEKLYSVKGIGKKRANLIINSYHELVGVRNIIMKLQKYGFSTAMCMKITNFYGDATMSILKQNPYTLIEDIDNVGFSTADKMALSIGFAKDSDFRIRAALVFVLQAAAIENGHTFLPKDELIAKCVHLLNLPNDLIKISLKSLELSDSLVKIGVTENEIAYALPLYYRAENEIAKKLQIMLKFPPPIVNTDFETKLEKNEALENIVLSATQRNAIKKALEEGLLVITGGPGTGKTTIIKTIINMMEVSKILLCAPTGRAAKRMQEATGCEAKTIHRLLEYSGEIGTFLKNENDPIKADCIIIDEVSMIDVLLMQSLLRAVSPGTKLILVGDADQLPSVGAGNVLGDLINVENIPHIRLTSIYRQSESSMITENAFKINIGELPILNNVESDFFFEQKNNTHDAALTINTLLTKRLPKFLKLDITNPTDIVSNIQVLTPTKKGECGTVFLNELIQNTLNPKTKDTDEIIYGTIIFRTGDKVIQMKNDYSLEYIQHKENGNIKGTGVFNGDIGFITEIYDDSILVIFDDDREVIYLKSQLDNLALAYSLTVHKSQGSEFPVVIIPVVGGPKPLLVRNLLYTAITRAQNMVVLVGRSDIITTMVNNNIVAKRYTRLQTILNQE